MHYTVSKILKTAALLFLTVTSLAQQSVLHPLSSYGLGDYQLQDHGIYSAMGNTAIPFIDSAQLNFLNPASYSALSNGNTLYSVGVNQRTSFFQQGNDRLVRSTGNMNHLALGFKLKKKMGMAFGITPYAAKGYYLSEKIFTGFDSIRNSYEGSGYINRMFLGYSYAPVHTPFTFLSVGMNAGFLFGGVRDQRTSQLIQGTTATGGLYREELRIQAMNVETGIAFAQRIGSRYEVKLGALYAPKLALAGSLNQVLYSATNLNNPSTYLTLTTQDITGHVIQGQRFSFGLVHQVFLRDQSRKNKTKHPQLSISLQYAQQSAFKYQFSGSSYDPPPSTVRNSHIYQAGFEFRPERFLYENLATLGFFDKFIYRMGAYYGTLPYYDAGNNAFKAQGVTLGIGIPILAQQSLSSINLSCILGQRGTFQSGALTEHFVAIQLGAVLAPAGFERWFRKRKMD